MHKHMFKLKGLYADVIAKTIASETKAAERPLIP